MAYLKIKYDPLGNPINATQINYFPKNRNTKYKNYERIDLRKETGDSYEES